MASSAGRRRSSGGKPKAIPSSIQAQLRFNISSSCAAFTKRNPTPRGAKGTICGLSSVGSRRGILGFAGTSKSGSGVWGQPLGKPKRGTPFADLSPEKWHADGKQDFSLSLKSLRKSLVQTTCLEGFEPTTFSSEVRSSIRLSDRHRCETKLRETKFLQFESSRNMPAGGAFPAV